MEPARAFNSCPKCGNDFPGPKGATDFVNHLCVPTDRYVESKFYCVHFQSMAGWCPMGICEPKEPEPKAEPFRSILNGLLPGKI